MRIVVTGASGFIGSAVVNRLLERGHDVIAASRNPKNAESEARQNVTWIIGSLDRVTADRIINLNPDACIHSAWVATPGIYLESDENDKLLEQSYQFVMRLQAGSVRRIVVVGTCLEKLPEHSSKYVSAKQALHKALEITTLSGVDLCWTRVFFPYGRGEHPMKLPSYLISKLSRDEIPIIKSPNTINDYIHIEDVAHALVLVAESGKSGIYEIGSGTGISVISIANIIAIDLGKQKLLEAYSVTEANINGTHPTVIADRATIDSLGWEPQISMAAGIHDLIHSGTLTDS